MAYLDIFLESYLACSTTLVNDLVLFGGASAVELEAIIIAFSSLYVLYQVVVFW